MPTTFRVTLLTYRLPDEPTTYIIQPESFFDDQARQVLAAADDRIAVEKVTQTKAQEDWDIIRHQRTAAVLARIEDQRARHAALRNESNPTEYYLRKPSHGELLKAKEAARQESKSGEIVYDPDKLQETLFQSQGAVQDADGKNLDVKQLDPVIAATLRQKLFSSIVPDESRLPNSSLP